MFVYHIILRILSPARAMMYVFSLIAGDWMETNSCSFAMSSIGRPWFVLHPRGLPRVPSGASGSKFVPSL